MRSWCFHPSRAATTFDEQAIDLQFSIVARDPKLTIVEDTYDFERPEPEWLGGLPSQIGTIPGVVCGYAYEVARVDGRPKIGRSWFEKPELLSALLRAWSELPLELTNLFVDRPPMVAQTTSEVLRDRQIDFDATPIPTLFATVGFADALGITALAPSGVGLVLGMGLQHRREFGQAERDTWSHVAAHVAAGVRLRNRLGTDRPIEHADAVLRPDGKLEHAISFDASVGELLREAVMQVEHARSSTHEHDAHKALELWKGLVDGRWSLLDHYEGGGRRYYVAVRNSPEAARAHGLTPREAEVVAYLASGTSTKATAYALGLDAVTIRSHLRSALAKLGLHSRTDLIRLRARLVQS